MSTKTESTSTRQIKPRIKAITLVEAVCDAFEIPVERIFTGTRDQPVVNARKCYLFFFCVILGNGPALTGRHVYRTHAAIIYAVRKYTDHYSLEADYRERANKVMNAYRQGILKMPKPGSKIL